jgi:hypothetical protein
MFSIVAFAMHVSLAILLLTIGANSVEGQDYPTVGHAYSLYNQYSGDNPYQYLAWTTSSQSAYQASLDNPGVFMEQSSANVVPPKSLWVFDLQTDGTYRVFNTDNSYGSSEKCLDVRADGKTPFMYNDGTRTQASGKWWQLIPWGDGTFQMYNPYWNKVLDINSGGYGSDYTINGPVIGTPQQGLDGQRWELENWTPVASVTVISVITQVQTVRPPAMTSTLNSPGMRVTSTTTIYDTQVSSTQQKSREESKMR